jgi:prepilin-type N-terminal cleavage/methylation domain-containing protein
MFTQPAIADLRRRVRLAFTLVEVLISVAVISIVFVTLYFGISAGFSVVTTTREDLRATQILNEKLETMRLYTWSQLNDNTTIPRTFTNWYYELANANDLGVAYTGSVAITAVPFSNNYSAGMRQVRVGLGWMSGRVPRYREAYTYVSSNGLQKYIMD